MHITRKKALVIGCGVAGPVVALFLKRAGIDADIYEAQPTPDDYAGLFLNVSSNGLEVLRTLGIHADVAAEGFVCPHMVLWSGRGKQLGKVRNGAPPEQGVASVVIKRGVLQRILRDAALREGVPLHFGKQVTSITRTDEYHVVASFADGTTATGDFLVGCDGLHSRTRQLMDPSAPAPSYTGQISCGGFSYDASVAPTPGTQHFVFGERAFFGYLAKPDGEIYWFSNLAYPGTPRRSDLEAIPQHEWQNRLLELYSNDQPFIQAIIRATRGDIGRYPIYDIPTVPRWHVGSVVLLGDAAHATSPSAGQGVSLALEDAIVLAQCVRDIPHLEDAFAAYERLRRKRAEKIVQASRRTGSTKVAANPLARWLRDLMMPVFLKLLGNARSLNWLYSYKVAWDEPVANV